MQCYNESWQKKTRFNDENSATDVIHFVITDVI